MKIKEGGNGTNRSTVDGRTTKDQFTRRLKSCPNVIRRFREKVNCIFESLRFFDERVRFLLTNLATHPNFSWGEPLVSLQYAGATVKLRAARRLHLSRMDPSRMHVRHPSPTPQAMSRGADMVLIQEKT
jgi:hypothetical protein